ncbi:Guanine nucleotide-binding protein subunit beta-2-like 1 [Dipsacomyces acuminosporus]|nr:Guanine nucleotide-binding protein subunit beta-2-like 1 [Dipsacomyces acuminosporus]
MVSEFVGHQSDVLSVCTSPDGSQIVSASRDGRIKVWNARGEYQHDLTENRQTDAVYAICFLPSTRLPMVVSAGWDKTVKVWDFDRMKLFCKLGGHRDHIHTVAVSTDGSVCASGGREGKVMLWNLTSYQHLHSFNTGDSIHSLAFSPSQSWLAAATTSHIHIWDIATRLTICKLYTKSIGDSPSAAEPKCLSLAWSADGSVLFGGYSDSTIRVWEVESG